MAKKHPGGRPTRYNKTYLPLIAKLAASKGFTNEQLAELLGITDRTLYNWQKRYPEFFQSLKEGKQEPINRLENSLYRTAEGYDVWEETEYYDEEKKAWISHSRKKKHVPGNPTALIFSLCNLDNKRWKRKQEVVIEDKTIIIERIKPEENE